MMKIVIFGGTTESRRLSAELVSAGAHVTVSVTSEYGAQEQSRVSGVQISQGARDAEGMRALIRGTDLCIDATHPYATDATRNIDAAARSEGVEVIRLARDESPVYADMSGSDNVYDDIYIADDAHDAAVRALSLAGEQGSIMLTTGSGDIGVFAEIIGCDRLFPRILPLRASLDACADAGIPYRNITAMQGPFSADFNEAMIRELDISVMITKDGGRAGGIAEKIAACKACGIPMVMIRRPDDKGMSYDEVLRYCLEEIKCM